MIYKKTHTSIAAFNDHLSKIKERGMAYRTNGMTIEYCAIEKSKDASIKSTNSIDLIIDLIMEAGKKGYRKVKVVFVKIKLSDFPKSTHNSPSVKKVVGTQKTEIFDVIEDTDDIVELLKNKDVEKMNFI